MTGGGLSLCGDEWIEAGSGKWLFPTRALGEVYRARYLEGLDKLYAENGLEFHGSLGDWPAPDRFRAKLRKASRKRWHVYAKAPFAGPEQVLSYLSLYTHRVAISQKRIREVDAEAGTVRFRYKDYGENGKWKAMILGVEEFARRFAQHILPRGFCKIRHCGILSNGNRRDKIALCRVYLEGVAPPTPGGEPGGEMPARTEATHTERLGYRGRRSVGID